MEKENQFQQLWDDSKQMASSHYDLLRLEMLEKSAGLFNLLLVTILALLLLFTAAVFLAVALTHLIGDAIGSIGIAYLMMAGLFLLVFLVVYLCRKRIFNQSLSRQIAQILFPTTGAAPKREIVDLECKHQQKLVERDLEVIKAHLMGVQIAGNLIKKAVTYVENRLFDAEEDDELYAEHPHSDVVEEAIHSGVEGEEAES